MSAAASAPTVEAAAAVHSSRPAPYRAEPLSDIVYSQTVTIVFEHYLPTYIVYASVYERYFPAVIVYADHLCVGVLEPHAGKRKIDMGVREISRVKMPHSKFIAHSHSPGLTANFFINKIDNFVKKTKGETDYRDVGMLKYMHQNEDNLWLVMDRRTNVSRILNSGDFGFINNHFANIHEVRLSKDTVQW